MPFVQPAFTRIVGGTGPKDARIMLIGEALGSEEQRLGKPFCGPAGSVLDQCLHAAGIIRSHVYITNVVKLHPRNNDITPFFQEGKGKQLPHFTEEGAKWVEKLWQEIDEVKPNVIVPLGNTAMCALTGMARVMKYRGYVMESSDGRFKVIPTIHPSASLRGSYIYRYYITADLRKAVLESEFPEVRRPDRELVYSFNGPLDAVRWIDSLAAEPRLGFDIEVLNYGISCIGISPRPNLAVSIPLADGYWGSDPARELPIWRALDRLLSNEKVEKVFQNGSFDIQFLASDCGMIVRGPIKDTMIAHSLWYPDMLKGLGFLGSLYCGAQEYWKDMVRFDDIKEES